MTTDGQALELRRWLAAGKTIAGAFQLVPSILCGAFQLVPSILCGNLWWFG